MVQNTMSFSRTSWSYSLLSSKRNFNTQYYAKAIFDTVSKIIKMNVEMDIFSNILDKFSDRRWKKIGIIATIRYAIVLLEIM